MIKSWEQRSPEVANLLNPAFCTILLQNAVRGYQSQKSEGMPSPLIFLILPLVLHPKTTETLPNTIKKGFHSWLKDNPEVIVGFSTRAENLIPHTKEALAFGIKSKIFEISDAGDIAVAKHKILRKTMLREIWTKKSESYRCYSSAKFIGKWLSKIKEESTIFIALGVRP
jgi:hypothetical protein